MKQTTKNILGKGEWYRIHQRCTYRNNGKYTQHESGP